MLSYFGPEPDAACSAQHKASENALLLSRDLEKRWKNCSLNCGVMLRVCALWYPRRCAVGAALGGEGNMIESTSARFRVPVVATLLASAIPAFGEPLVFLQRQGSPDDNGYMDFVESAPGAVLEDFEDPSLFAEGTAVAALTGAGIKVDLEGEWNGPYVPEVFASSEFNYPEAFYNQALIGGTELRLVADRSDPARAVGVWIFDDNSSYDSVYLIRIAECGGGGDSVVLANETEFTAFGHELEGFVGAVSDVGICVFSITAIDPVTGLPNGDLFEIDHVMIESFEEPGPSGTPVLAGRGDDRPGDRWSRGDRRNRGFGRHRRSDRARRFRR